MVVVLGGVRAPKKISRLETWKGLQGTCRPRARSGPGRPTDRRGRSLASSPATAVRVWDRQVVP